jgi:hypothetical protein
MDFNCVITTLNKLLSRKNPESFNGSWILKYAPRCYRFIQKNVRTEIGGIDWDKVTYALEWKFQRRWAPGHWRKKKIPYKNQGEVKAVLNKYHDKLYTFIAPIDINDRRTRDIISITLVRIAQNGNILAKKELLKLVRYAVDDWIERYFMLSRWAGYDEEIQEKIEGCIRRYRYTGSFSHYVFKTLEYAGRGIRPFYAYSLDESIFDGAKRKIDNVGYDPETNEIKIYAKASR